MAIDIYAIPVWGVLSTATWGFFHFIRIVRLLAREPLAWPPQAARLFLQPLVRWGLLTGLQWSVGVSLVIVFVGPEVVHHHRVEGVVPAVVAGLLAAVPAILFMLIPQLEFHRALTSERDGLLRSIYLQLSKRLHDLTNHGPSSARGRRAMLLLGQNEELRDLSAAATFVEGSKVWIYGGVLELVVIAADVLVPLGSVLHVFTGGW